MDPPPTESLDSLKEKYNKMKEVFETQQSQDIDTMSKCVSGLAAVIGTLFERSMGLLKPGGTLALLHFVDEYVDTEAVVEFMKPDYSKRTAGASGSLTDLQLEILDVLEKLGQPDPDDTTFPPVSQQQILRAKSLLFLWFKELPSIRPNVSSSSWGLSNDIIVAAPGASCRIEPSHTTASLYGWKDGSFCETEDLRMTYPCPDKPDTHLFWKVITHLSWRVPRNP